MKDESLLEEMGESLLEETGDNLLEEKTIQQSLKIQPERSS